MSHTFDATLKDMLGQDPADYVAAFGLPTTSPATVLNVDLSTLSAATDVAFGFGDPLDQIVDLNFQSGPDPILSARLHLYNAAFHFRFNVPVRSVAILLRPKADSSNLIGNLTYVSDGRRVEFQHDVVRMWQLSPTLFLNGGLGLLPLATLCKIPEGRTLEDGLREVVREIDRRLVAEADHSRAVRLMTAAFILGGLRVKQKVLGTIFEGVRVMHETTAFDYYVEQGEIRGEIRGTQQTLLRQGKRRFGEPDAEMANALKAVQDLDRLERMADAIFTAKSWQELLDTP